MLREKPWACGKKAQDIAPGPPLTSTIFCFLSLSIKEMKIANNALLTWKGCCKAQGKQSMGKYFDYCSMSFKGKI